MKIPTNILKSWIRVNTRIDNFCEGNRKDSFVCLFITDVHTGGNNKIRQIEYLHELIKLNKVDFLVNGGDIGLDIGEDLIEAKRLIDVTKKAMEFDFPHILIKGNHDHKIPIMSNYDFLTYVNESADKFLNKNFNIIYDETYGGGYGYYIDEKTSTRIIFLNTSECTNSGYEVSDKQIQCFINFLNDSKENNIIVFSHYCLNDCGMWHGSNIEGKPFVLEQIEKDFSNKNKGQYENIKWDFTNSKSKMICHLAGDSHFNNESYDDGFLCACRQGYGGIDPKDMHSGATFDKFDFRNQCNFDILVINPKNKIKLFRIGVGEEKRDIEITK